jgi:glycosyltransferase involved in cell wall biosynthesis
MHIFIINNASMMKIISLYEAMDGRALLQLYKIGISRSNKTDALLNDGLKSTYKMRLRIGVYTRF